jgi:hypothetical protein
MPTPIFLRWREGGGAGNINASINLAIFPARVSVGISAHRSDINPVILDLFE